MVLKATIPYPPSVNQCWRKSGKTIYLNPIVGVYRKSVAFAMLYKPSFGKAFLRLEIKVYPPDNRRRDIDNILKVTLDALQKAGVYEDDSQICQLYVEKYPKKTNGELEIQLSVI